MGSALRNTGRAKEGGVDICNGVNIEELGKELLEVLIQDMRESTAKQLIFLEHAFEVVIIVLKLLARLAIELESVCRIRTQVLEGNEKH